MIGLLLLAASVLGASPARPARANLTALFNTNDYPAEALRNDQQGTATVALKIDAKGRVSRCRVIRSSQFASLDLATCAVIQARARYTPALNSRGKVVASQDRATIRWALPESTPVPVAQAYWRATFDLATDGTFSKCQYLSDDRLALHKNDCAGATAMVAQVPDVVRRGFASKGRRLTIASGELLGRDVDGSLIRSAIGPGELFGFAVSFDIDRSGQAHDCDVRGYGETVGNDRANELCGQVLRMKYEPIEGAAGPTTQRRLTSFLVGAVHD